MAKHQKMKLVFSLIFLTLFIGCAPTAFDKNDLIIQNVNLIDVASGKIQEHMDVIVRDSKVLDIHSYDSLADAKAIEKIDGTDKYLIPGLWDMHVHIQDSSYLKMFLNFGIVGIRDMGGCASKPTDGCESLCSEKLANWRELVKTGQLEGPNLYIAGPVLSGTGWPSSLPANNIYEVQIGIQKLVELDVDFVKVYDKIPAETYREIARLCKLNNLDFAGHASESLLLSEISEMGQKSIEHIREQILFCFTNDPNELETFLEADNYSQDDKAFVKPWIDDAEIAIEAFKRNETWFVPTMVVQYANQRYNDSLWVNNPLRKQLPDSVNKGFTEHLTHSFENPDKNGYLLYWIALNKLVKRFNENKIGLLAGTDMACEGGIPGFSLHEELQLLNSAGLTPLEALKTATINPAKFLNLPFNGQIKESFYADMILLNANPLEDIKNTLSINMVIRNGNIIKN